MRIVSILAILLGGTLMFILGMMTHSAMQSAPMVVMYSDEKTLSEDVQSFLSVSSQKGKVEESDRRAPTEKGGIRNCQYVGSKNSTKYYPPTCSFAKRIAPQNLRCFLSDEDAQSQGYERSRGC